MIIIERFIKLKIRNDNMYLNNLVKDPAVWEGNRGFNFSVELTGSNTADTVLSDIVKKLGEFYAAFNGSRMDEMPGMKNPKEYHVIGPDDKYRATIEVWKRASYGEPANKEKPGRDFAANVERGKRYRVFWVKVPHMAHEEKREGHLSILADYLKRGPIAIDAYKAHKAMRKTGT